MVPEEANGEMRDIRDLTYPHIQKRVEHALRRLTAREQRVLRMRFGIGEPPQDADAVSRRLGVASQRVEYIETHALGTLRAYALSRPSSASGLERRVHPARDSA